ncbi:TPD1 protein homolog 1-like [Castanea sativa]|uniref:TPD1 protein homolog 1-like n=1 Tax=Castanea sativa TaxID=21020 RepID=UPI003F64ABBA
MASVTTVFIAGLLVLAVHNVNGGDCLKNYIQVTQGTTGNLPSGTPIFSVQITNECPRDCSIAQIHLSCDSFASELLINPMIFRKLGINDCLVNNGKPLANGAAISFKYASNAKLPLAVSSLTCSP